jgi:hypothetical protein
VISGRHRASWASAERTRTWAIEPVRCRQSEMHDAEASAVDVEGNVVAVVTPRDYGAPLKIASYIFGAADSFALASRSTVDLDSKILVCDATDEPAPTEEVRELQVLAAPRARRDQPGTTLQGRDGSPHFATCFGARAGQWFGAVRTGTNRCRACDRCYASARDGRLSPVVRC